MRTGVITGGMDRVLFCCTSNGLYTLPLTSNVFEEGYICTEFGSQEAEGGFKSRMGIQVFTRHWLRPSLEIDASRGMAEAAIL
jgi:hypothetical protein